MTHTLSEVLVGFGFACHGLGGNLMGWRRQDEGEELRLTHSPAEATAPTSWGHHVVLSAWKGEEESILFEGPAAGIPVFCLTRLDS
jgi:hypothetical protein